MSENFDKATDLPPVRPANNTEFLPEVTPEVPEPPAEIEAPEPTEPAAQAHAKKKVESSFAGGTWVALIIGALLLILLLIFILQNQQQVEITMFTGHFTFPAGVAFLLAAITGALIMAMVGGVRMFQLRGQIKKLQKK